MFPRHAQTRRQLVLLLFAALCVPPTFGVMAWCVWDRLPWRARAEAAWIGHLVGMNAALDDVRRPRFDTTLYGGLALADRESGQPVFSCRRVEIRRGWHDVESAAATGSVSADRPEKAFQRRPVVYAAFSEAMCSGTQSDAWLRIVDGLLTSRIGSADADLRCTFDRLEIRRGDRSLPPADVTATLVRAADGTVLDIDFRPADATGAKSGRLRVTRNRSSPPHTTQFELTCNEQTPAPCELLACVVPAFASMGGQSDFSGRLLGRETPDGWQYDVVDGLLRNVELDRLVGDRFPPHRVEATVDLRIDKAAVVAGRLVFAKGLLGSDQGRMSRSLAEACVGQLGLEGALATGAGVSFQRCETQFLLDDRGLQLAAFPRNGKTIFFAGDRPLFDAPPGDLIVPIAALLDALAPLRGAASEENAARVSLRRRLPLEAEAELAQRPPAKRR